MAFMRNVPKPIHHIKWNIVHAFYPQRKKGFNTSEVAFCFQKPLLDGRSRIELKIGYEVGKKLNWQPKDKISIFQNPDDEYHIMLVKSNGGNGFTLSTPSKTNHYFSLSFGIQFSLQESKTSFTNLKHEVYDLDKLVLVLREKTL